jgi:hypothetical protein
VVFYIRVSRLTDYELKGTQKPLPKISFTFRDQVLIWVSDPTSKARIRGIVVMMSVSSMHTSFPNIKLTLLQSYFDNIRTHEEVAIYEQQEIELNAGLMGVPNSKLSEFISSQELGTCLICV